MARPIEVHEGTGKMDLEQQTTILEREQAGTHIYIYIYIDHNQFNDPLLLDHVHQSLYSDFSILILVSMLLNGHLV